MYFILSLKRDGPPPSTKPNQATGQPAFILSFYLLHTCIITGKNILFQTITDVSYNILSFLISDELERIFFSDCQFLETLPHPFHNSIFLENSLSICRKGRVRILQLYLPFFRKWFINEGGPSSPFLSF